MRIGLLGLGELGRLYSHDLLSKGVSVTGYDPDATAVAAARSQAPQLRLAATEAEAVAGADLILSAVTAASAHAALTAALVGMPAAAPGAVYIDVNTGSPELKRSLAQTAAAAHVPFADVAVLAPVERAGLATALLISGDGAPRALELLHSLDVPVDDAGPEAGAAAQMKLLRSIFLKGLAGIVIEALTAATHTARPEAVTWLRGQMAAELGPGGDQFVDHLVASSVTHAGRRAHEMDDAAQLATDLGAPSWMTDGTRRWLHALADGEVTAPS